MSGRVLFVAFCALLMVSMTAQLQASGASTKAELPRLLVHTVYVPPSGRTLVVGAGGNFQTALNAAQPGDVISLEAGATFEGAFILPNKRGAGWIYVQSSAAARLPSGKRVTPADARLMPKIVSPNMAPTIRSEAGAHQYRFVGIEITTRHAVTTSTVRNLVLLGDSSGGNPAVAVDQLPRDIIFDRCYIHGTPTGNVRRGVLLNAIRAAVIDSYLADFHEAGADSQAIGVTNGPGPFKIVNNHLEAAGENVMFGGADPAIAGLVPSDIEIRRNRFSKPRAWKIGEPDYGGTAWTVKNLFELKNARRVVVEGNVFEHAWAQAQKGFAIVFTVRNQDGNAPWSVVEDITFLNNVVRHAASGINILGQDDQNSSQPTRRIVIRNNLFEDVNGPRWGGAGRLFQLVNGTTDVVIEHNTALHSGEIIAATPPSHRGFVFRNNIVLDNGAGIAGENTSGNIPLTLRTYFPGAVIDGNVFVGGKGDNYPPHNFYPPSLDAVDFVNPSEGDYRLAATSSYKRKGMGGRDPGVEFAALRAALGR